MVLVEIRQWIRQLILPDYLTISGEIIIGSSDVKRLISLNSETLTRVTKEAAFFRETYPYFKVKIDEGLHEITIKLYAQQVRFVSQNFHFGFRQDLMLVLSRILESGDLSVRINIYGYIESNNTVESFRYLNKNDEVSYKVTKTEPVNSLFKMVCRKVGFLKEG